MTEPTDVTALARDDALLDALALGDPAPDGDEVAALLAAWRSDLSPVSPVSPVPVPRRLFPRRLLAAAAAVVLLAAGLGVAARNAGPDSPLWPITRTVYSGQADSRVAERDASRAIALARTSMREGRYADADRQLDEAVRDIGKVRDKAAAQRLRREVDAVRGLLPGTVPAPTSGSSPPASSAAPSASPAPAPGGQGGTPTAAPGAGESTPSPTPSSDGGLLPDLPLPNLPLPSLPPLLPSLPPLLPG